MLIEEVLLIKFKQNVFQFIVRNFKNI